MSHNAEELVKGIALGFIDSCFSVTRTVKGPIAAAMNHLEACSTQMEDDSRIHLERVQSRARVHSRFVEWRKHLAMATDINGKYAYYFLTSIEQLPSPQCEEWMFRTTARLDSNPDVALRQIGKAMQLALEQPEVSTSQIAASESPQISDSNEGFFARATREGRCRSYRY